MDQPIDVSDTIVAKSDQLNADDLIGGPVTVQITKVSRVSGEQPIAIEITGGHQPWKPCKTMRRVLAKAWGDKDARAWVGRWLTLYREDGVKWAGVAVGGIRIKAMSDIPSRMTISLQETKGKKVEHKVEVLKPPAPNVMTFDTFKGWCSHAIDKCGWTKEQVTAAMGGKPSEVPPEKRAELAALFAKPPVIEPPTDPADAPQHGD